MNRFLSNCVAVLLLLLCFEQAHAQTPSPVFHFDFKNAAGKRVITDSSGKIKCISETADFQVEQGALRIASGARISIPGENVPKLSRAVTTSAWILKSSTPDVAPILMKGVHPEPIQFLFSVGWRYPVFSYKNQPRQNFWKGIYYNGYFGGSITYGDPAWQVKDSPLVETGGTWYHVVSTFNEGAVRIYVNGQLTAQYQSEKPELLADNDEPFYVGAEFLKRGDKIEPYATANMLLNDLRLYDQALSTEQVQAEYAGDRLRYPAQSLIPAGKTHTTALAPCYEYLGAEFDPLFRRKLKLTAEYEKRLPSDTLSGRPMTVALASRPGQPLGLQLNGKSEYPLAFYPAPMDYATAEYQMNEVAGGVRDFAAAGVNLVGVDALAQRFWLGDGEYDWAKFDEFFHNAIKANPQAKILAGVSLYPPPWFEKKYPEHLEKYLHGGQVKTMRLAGPLGSEVWLQASLKMIRDVVAHVEASEYSGHVLGYLCGGGQSAEWYWPGGLDGLVGYSAPTGESFRAWLRGKYRDEAALKKAWNNAQVTLGTASIPAPELRAATEASPFRIATVAQQEFDFREFLTASTVRHLTESARAVKEASNRKKLVFSYYGYAMSATGRPKLYNSGLQGLSQVLADPNVDCIVQLNDYVKRRGGQAGQGISPFYASARLHGKMLWEEHDYRTHLAFGTFSTDKTDGVEETNSVLQRSFGQSLIQGSGLWWRVFQNHWFHQNEVMESIAQMQRVGQESTSVDKAPVAQVAFIYDEKVPTYLEAGTNEFLRQHVWGAYEGAVRMGAPFDFYLLDDIKNQKMPDYRLYVFLNTYRLDAATRAAISAKVRKNNAVAVWCYAPGYMDGDQFSVDTMQELTGFQFKQQFIDQPRTFSVADTGHAITRFSKVGPTFKMGTTFTVNDPQAKVLATIGEGTAMAVKENRDWRSVYTLMPLNAELLQGLCDYAGVHVYSRSFDVLYANRSYVLLYTSSEGEKTIQLPQNARVREVLSGKQVGQGINHFTESVAKNTARIYRLETP